MTKELIYGGFAGYPKLTVRDLDHTPYTKRWAQGCKASLEFTNCPPSPNGGGWLSVRLTEVTPTIRGPKSRTISLTLDPIHREALRRFLNEGSEEPGPKMGTRP